jgi:magnesium chelatase subunit I
LESAIDVLGGKIEFESGEEGRERDILDHLLRMATAETVRELYRGIDLGPLVEALDGSVTVTTGEQITAQEFFDTLPRLNGTYDALAERFGATTTGQRASAVELALEGLYLARRISKDSGDGETLYG